MNDHSLREKNPDLNKRIVRIKALVDEKLKEMDREDRRENKKKGAPPG